VIMETMTRTVIPNKKNRSVISVLPRSVVVVHISMMKSVTSSVHILDLVGIRAGTGTGSSTGTGNMCNIDAAPYPAPQAHHLSTLNVCFIPQINDVTVPVWQQDLGVRGHAEEEEGRIKQENEEQDPVERCFTPG
jgi:hypothetical protein